MASSFSCVFYQWCAATAAIAIYGFLVVDIVATTYVLNKPVPSSSNSPSASIHPVLLEVHRCLPCIGGCLVDLSGTLVDSITLWVDLLHEIGFYVSPPPPPPPAHLPWTVS
jgi:hypothetical protein